MSRHVICCCRESDRDDDDDDDHDIHDATIRAYMKLEEGPSLQGRSRLSLFIQAITEDDSDDGDGDGPYTAELILPPSPLWILFQHSIT